MNDSQTTLAPIDRAALRCADGRHTPSLRIVRDEKDVEHTRCRRCGCELARSEGFHRWYRTGQLG